MSQPVVGQYGIPFPADVGGLREAGIDFLTTAFRASGVLSSDNAVTSIDDCTPVHGGSTGRKALLTVRYRRPEPGLRTELFAKFSRDLDDPVRDLGRTQMESEVALANLASSPRFPVAVPHPQFADYHRPSGTGLLITERIAFGRNGIEPQYEKAMDHRIPDQYGHYRALLSAVAALAGTQQSGALGAGVIGEVAQGLGTRGHAQQHHADVFHHGQQHLAQDFGLGADLGCAGEGRQAGEHAQAVEAAQAIHQPRHAGAKVLGDAVARMIEHIAHRKAQGGDAGVRVEAQRSGDQGGAEGVLPHRLVGAQGARAIQRMGPGEGFRHTHGVAGLEAFAEQFLGG